MKLFVKVLLVLLLLLLAACGSSFSPEEPPEILYGEDVCDRCNMIINEERFAAALWTTTGESMRFDDIGGMLAFLQESSLEVATYWVHDVGTGEWLRAEDAYFVVGSSLVTPMGFGIVATMDEAAADALIGDGAAALVLDFHTLQSQVAAGELALDPMQHMHTGQNQDPASAEMPAGDGGHDHDSEMPAGDMEDDHDSEMHGSDMDHDKDHGGNG